MNETYNRMFNLVIDESQAIEQFFQRKAGGADQAATTPKDTTKPESDMLRRARASAAKRGKPVAVAKPKGGVFKPGNRPLTPEEQAAKLKAQGERRGRRDHLDFAARRQGLTSLAKAGGNIILPWLRSGGTVKKDVLS